MRPLSLSLVVCAALTGCGGNLAPQVPAAPSDTSTATIVLSVTPNPIVEDATCLCGGLPNRAAALGRLEIRETSGVAVRIDALRASARQTASGTVMFERDFSAADVAGHASGQNRVPGGGTLEVIDVGGHYDRSLSAAGTMTIDVRGVTDRGTPVTATLAVAIMTSTP